MAFLQAEIIIWKTIRKKGRCMRSLWAACSYFYLIQEYFTSYFLNRFANSLNWLSWTVNGLLLEKVWLPILYMLKQFRISWCVKALVRGPCGEETMIFKSCFVVDTFYIVGTYFRTGLMKAIWICVHYYFLHWS